MIASSGIRRSLVLATLFGHIGSAWSLGSVSRACNFSSDFPSLLKGPIANVSRLLGMPESLLNLPSRSLEEQSRYWALESITADYGVLRYYLFAESRFYRYKQAPDGKSINWVLEVTHKSPWAAQSLPPEVVNDPSFAGIFNFNRKVLWSARAGHADIWQQWPKVNPMYGNQDSFWVLGKHYYFDPVTKSQGYIGQTSVISANKGGVGCNLTQWAFTDR